MRALLSAGVWALLTATLSSQEPESGPVPEAARANILVRVEWIEIEHAALTRLMQERELVQDGTRLRRRLQEMVKKKEAAIFDTTMVTALSGERSRVEAAREWIYPTEYEPPGQLPIGPQANGFGALGGAGDFPISPALATAFETREVGVFLEVEATVAKGGTRIELQCAPEIVSKVDSAVYFERKQRDGMEEEIRFPTFESLRAQSNLTLADGAYALTNVLVRKTAPGKRLLMMVRCDVLD